MVKTKMEYKKSIVRFKIIGPVDETEKCCTVSKTQSYLKDRLVQFDIRIWLSEGCVDWSKITTKEMCKICYLELVEGAVIREPQTD